MPHFPLPSHRSFPFLDLHATTPFTTSPGTLVSRRSIPLWSLVNRPNSVAWKSRVVTTSVTAW